LGNDIYRGGDDMIRASPFQTNENHSTSSTNCLNKSYP